MVAYFLVFVNHENGLDEPHLVLMGDSDAHNGLGSWRGEESSENKKTASHILSNMRAAVWVASRFRLRLQFPQDTLSRFRRSGWIFG